MTYPRGIFRVHGPAPDREFIFASMNTVYLLLGSNEGDRLTYLTTALQAITTVATVLKVASIYETEAWGPVAQPGFLNAAVAAQTTLGPVALLKEINRIEEQQQRQRTVKWGQRTLDIDLLFFNEEVIDNPRLTIPHPRLAERRFALTPLAEIAPDLRHPVSKKTMTELLDECSDPLQAERFIQVS